MAVFNQVSPVSIVTGNLTEIKIGLAAQSQQHKVIFPVKGNEGSSARTT